MLYGKLENDSDGEGDATREALFELAKKKGVDVYQVLTETLYALTTPTHYATKRRYDPILPEAEEYLLALPCGNVSSHLNNARGQLSSQARRTCVPVAKVVDDFKKQIAVVEKSERETFAAAVPLFELAGEGEVCVSCSRVWVLASTDPSHPSRSRACTAS